MDYTFPGEEDIAEAVTWLQLNHDGGSSGMKAEHLRVWHRAAKREENLNLGGWEKVVAIIQSSFMGVGLVALYSWQTVIMISKWVGTNFRGIFLVEFLCKAISGSQFQDFLYGFRAGDFPGGVPHYSPRTKSIQKIMELDAGYRLTQDLHQDNPPEVGTYSLGDHDHCLPGV